MCVYVCVCVCVCVFEWGMKVEHLLFGGGLLRRLGDDRFRLLRVRLRLAGGVHLAGDVGHSRGDAVKDGRNIDASTALNVFKGRLEFIAALFEQQVVVCEVESVRDADSFQSDVGDAREDGQSQETGTSEDTGVAEISGLLERQVSVDRLRRAADRSRAADRGLLDSRSRLGAE